MEKSCNQSVLPHAVIVLNKSSYTNQDERWDVEKATEQLTESIKDVINKNPALKARAEFWKTRGKSITDVKSLLMCYYASFKVVRIPEQGSPNLLKQQIERLYDVVSQACKASQKRREESRRRLDAETLLLFLRNAFAHFATHLEKPFNFVQASFEIDPASEDSNFGEGILQLAVTLQKILVADVLSSWERMSELVASCIMLDATRRPLPRNFLFHSAS